MHIKFLGGGGSGAAAAAYLTAEKDAQGIEREAVTVLRGDPELVADVADSLDFAHTYTSGVLAWAPDDEPTGAEIEAVLDEFEQTAWAGLEPDRYAWTAVQHDEPTGAVHVHILAARVDLETGKSLNIAPPGWQQHFDPLRDWQNELHGWSRPDDPALQRDVELGYTAYLDAAALRQGLAVAENPRQVLTAYLTEGVVAGVIQDRAGIVQALEEVGLTVPRQGEHYLTAQDPETGEKWRLKGVLYERDFEGPGLAAPAAGADRGAEAGDRAADRERAEEAELELSRVRAARAEYHHERYGAAERSRAAELRPAVVLDREPELGAGLELEPGQLGAGAVVDVQHREPPEAALGAPGRHRSPASDLAPDRGADLGRGLSGDGDGPLSDPAGGQRDGVEGWRQASRAALAKVREFYDRTRDAIVAGVGSLIEAIHDGAAAAERADRDLESASRAVERASAAVDTTLQALMARRAEQEQARQREREQDQGAELELEP